jgi:O-antigen ligase
MPLNIIVLVSLFGSVTGYLPISPLLSLVALCFPLRFLEAATRDALMRALLGLLLFCLLSLLLYDPAALLQYDFYRRDGNLFACLSSLLAICIIPGFRSPTKVVLSFLVWVCATHLAYIVYHLLYDSESIYFFFFQAKNAAGGFLGTCIALSLPLYSIRGRYAIITLLLVICFLLTDSRGSLLALLLSFSVYCLTPAMQLRALKSTLIVVPVLASVLFWLYADRVEHLYSAPNPRQFGEYHLFDGYMERGWTIVDRFGSIWPRAVHYFLSSPIVGLGYGSFNDPDKDLVGYRGLWMRNISDARVYDDSHAHNTYLHLLAEVGVIGYALFGYFTVQMLRRLHRVSIAPLRNGLLLAFFTAIFASLTEHRFATPSQMMPFLLCSIVVISSENRLLVLQNRHRRKMYIRAVEISPRLA